MRAAPPNTFQSWWVHLPPVTKAYSLLYFICTIIISFQLINPYYFHLDFSLVAHNLEIWRLILPFVWSVKLLSMDFILHLYFFLLFSRKLEDSLKQKRYAKLVLFGAIAILGLSYATEMIPNIPHNYFPRRSFIFMIVYIWTRKNPRSRETLFGIFDPPSYFIPWIFLFIGFLLGHSVLSDIIGFIAAHIYETFETAINRRY